MRPTVKDQVTDALTVADRLNHDELVVYHGSAVRPGQSPHRPVDRGYSDHNAIWVTPDFAGARWFAESETQRIDEYVPFVARGTFSGELIRLRESVLEQLEHATGEAITDDVRRAIPHLRDYTDADGYQTIGGTTEGTYTDIASFYPDVDLTWTDVYVPDENEQFTREVDFTTTLNEQSDHEQTDGLSV